MIDVLAYGGGVQSVAMCILVARRILPRPDHIVFADTSREVRSTHQYRDIVMAPYLAAHGLRIEVADHEHATVDLYGNNGDLLLPAHTKTGKLQTFCSGEWKQRVSERYLRARYGYKTSEIVAWLGFSYDERRRIKSHDRRVYPLAVNVLRRADCVRIIQHAGLAVPRKSRCWCCPHQTRTEWQELPADELSAAVLIDEEIRDADFANGRSGFYLHSSRKPLAEAINDDEGDKEDTGRPCQEGWCFV